MVGAGATVKRFQPTPEPDDFDTRCRQPGVRWLQENPGYSRPKDYWSQFEDQLRNAFSGLCAYSVMRMMKGQVDHFVPIAQLKQQQRHAEAYEWHNFRYADGFINQKKHSHTVLDPFLVEDDWFEILLPSLQLVLTDRVPAQYRSLAAFTIDRLGLAHGEVVLRYRREFFELWQQGKIDIETLDHIAPLISAAIRRHPVYGAI